MGARRGRQRSALEWRETQAELQARRLEIESANQELQALNQQIHFVRAWMGQQEDLLSSVVDALCVPTLVLRPELQVLRANRAFYRSFHADPQTTLGRPLARVANARWDEPALQQALRQVAESRQPLLRMEFELTGMGRETRTAAASANVAETPRGLRIVCCLEDVTARKRAEELLASRLDLLGHTSAALALVDAHQRVVYVNPALEAISGYTVRELMGQNLHNVLHQIRQSGGTYQRADCPIDCALRNGHAASGEDLFRRKDGSYFAVRWQAQPLRKREPNDVQNPGAGVLELHDVSNERHLLDSLLTSEKLATAGRAAATIAHEINNPLGAIGNALYAIGALLEAQPPDRARLAGLVRTGRAELDRVCHIVQATLGLYRNEQAPVATDVNAVCLSALELMEERARGKHVQLRTRLRAQRRPVLQPGDLRQVLINLLGNAVDAAAGGGRVALASYDAGTGVRLLVGDNGAGIAGPVRARMFEPFLTTKGGKGTGLGLWVTAELVRAHGGRIRVKSCTSAPSGTCFAITLH
ncbi:MAG: ATP-binding protein [Terriglobales bacterium]